MSDDQTLALDMLRLQIPEAKDGSLDALLLTYLDAARDLILSLTHRIELPSALITAQSAIALIFFTRRGMEGQRANALGDVRRETFDGADDLPPTLMQTVRAWRLLNLAKRGQE